KHFSSSRIAKGILDGWQLSGITHYASGDPLGVPNPNVNCVPADACQKIGTFQSGTAGAGLNATWFGTPDIKLTALILQNPQKAAGYTSVGTHWLNPGSITLPAVNQFGTFEQPSFKGPGSANWNITLFKSFLLGERRRLELRWATFDIFNYAHPDDPQTTANFNWCMGLSDKDGCTLPVANPTSYRQGYPVLTNPQQFGTITDKHGHREMEVAIKIYF
ncbi:MAG: hypothetical protein DMG26_11935, partial [Acidobacteria bacterium]